jgi:hypothetical protein
MTSDLVAASEKEALKAQHGRDLRRREEEDDEDEANEEEDEDDEDEEEEVSSLPSVSVKKRVARHPLAGLACVALACSLNTTATALVKLQRSMDTSLMVAWRAVIIIMLSVPASIWSRGQRRQRRVSKNLTHRNRKDRNSLTHREKLWLLGRSLSMSVSTICVFFAIRNMPLGKSGNTHNVELECA